MTLVFLRNEAKQFKCFKFYGSSQHLNKNRDPDTIRVAINICFLLVLTRGKILMFCFLNYGEACE
jgi:hypothetical protein